MKNAAICAALMVFCAGSSYADCATGYACSIDELKKEIQPGDEISLNEPDISFKNEINEKFIPGSLDKNIKYKDLFPYTIILENSKMQF